MPWVAEEFGPWLGAVLEDPAGALPAIAEGMSPFVARPEVVLEMWKGPAEAPVVDRPVVRDALVRWLREAVRQGGLGIAADVVAGSRGDPIPADQVRVPAHLWYGEADAIGPRHGEWYAGRLPVATLTVLPGAGHLLPVAHWRTILDAALS